MSLASSWHDASLLLSSRASQKVATSSGRPGGDRWTCCASLNQWLFPALPWGRGCPSLTSSARHRVGFSQHLLAVSAFIFSDLTVLSPFWPFPSEAAQGGRGHQGTQPSMPAPGRLWGQVASPDLWGCERNPSGLRAQAVKHLPCNSTQAGSVFPLRTL